MSTLHNRAPPAGPCGAAELHELSQCQYRIQPQQVSRISPERVSRISPVAHAQRCLQIGRSIFADKQTVAV
jgi:hypothetical protein